MNERLVLPITVGIPQNWKTNCVLKFRSPQEAAEPVELNKLDSILFDNFPFSFNLEKINKLCAKFTKMLLLIKIYCLLSNAHVEEATVLEIGIRSSLLYNYSFCLIVFRSARLLQAFSLICHIFAISGLTPSFALLKMRLRLSSWCPRIARKLSFQWSC